MASEAAAELAAEALPVMEALAAAADLEAAEAEPEADFEAADPEAADPEAADPEAADAEAEAEDFTEATSLLAACVAEATMALLEALAEA